MERIGRSDSTGDVDLQESATDALELRFWVSFRGQTLARTGQKQSILISTPKIVS